MLKFSQDDETQPLSDEEFYKKHENYVTTDQNLKDGGRHENDRYGFRTPEALHDKKGRKRPGQVVDEGHKEPKGFARIDVSSSYDEHGVTITYEVTSNPDYVSVRQGTRELKDLIEISLEKDFDTQCQSIALVETTPQHNYHKGQVRYTWAELATVLKVKVPRDGSARDLVTSAYPQLGVVAQFLGHHSPREIQVNGQNHTSGGLGRKGGSGVVPLRPITLEDLARSEQDERNTQWNMGQDLGEDTVDRSVFQNHKEIMQSGRDFTTTLEAESEYVVEGEKELQQVISGIGQVPGIKDNGTKTYFDHYYDIVGSEKNDLELLKRGIVLRERRVPSKDDDNEFLFAVKGHTHDQVSPGGARTGERMRLSAQTHFHRTRVLEDGGKGTALTQLGQKGLNDFVCDTSVDNSFGRTLDHALDPGHEGHGGESMKKLLGGQGNVKPVLQIESDRHKFEMKLPGGATIDVSADKAKGYVVDPATGKRVESDRPPVVCSFEFGLGHPGLNATATTTTTSTDDDSSSKVGKLGSRIDMFNGGAPVGTDLYEKNKKTRDRPLIVRPYHVPKDVENDELFKKNDYLKFMRWRDSVLTKTLHMPKESLRPGGNKAQLLAQALGLI